MMTFTTVLVATNVMGSLPDNPLSFGLRQAAANALPEPFSKGLNQTLMDAGLPTLPAPQVQEAAVFEVLDVWDPVIAATDPDLVPATAPSAAPQVTPVPTSVPAPTAVRTQRPATTDLLLEKLDSGMAGIWAMDFDVGTDYYTIEAQGDGYVVTFIEQAGVDFTPVDSQSWDGVALTFVYSYPTDNGATIVTIQILSYDAKFMYGTYRLDYEDGTSLDGDDLQIYRITDA